MTPKEHAKVWRKAADDYRARIRPDDVQVFYAILQGIECIATAYEQAAKEQEGRE